MARKVKAIGRSKTITQYWTLTFGYRGYNLKKTASNKTLHGFNRKALVTALAVTLSAGVSSVTLAAEETVREEIVVTAQRRAQNILDIPYTYTTYTSYIAPYWLCTVTCAVMWANQRDAR